jgi:hypothetical membrane protein
MLNLEPRIVRLRLLPASYLVFLVSMLASALIFHHGKQFDAKSAILSDLQSPDENPHGYRLAAVGTAVAAILLLPAAASFYGQLRHVRPKLALTGVVMLVVGSAAAIGVGIFAPFTHGYTPAHVQLASASFIGVSVGILANLLAARAAPALLIFQSAALLLLVFLCYGPVEFSNDRLLTSLAFWEWVLCVECGAALWALSGVICSKRGS